MELQFYAFFMVVLSGVALGLLFDLLRAMRGYYRPNRWVAAIGDLLFWGAAVVVFASGLFLGNWGDFRFYVLVALCAGLGLYYWLASPVLLALMHMILRLVTWLLDFVWLLVLKLVWVPVLAFISLLWRIALTLWDWTYRLLNLVWNLLDLVGHWLSRPLIKPLRCVKLRYLLLKRKVRRKLRRLFMGPGPGRK